MCVIKRFRDFHFPFNFFGKKMRTVTYKLPSGTAPVIMYESFTGDRIDSCYTNIYVDVNTGEEEIVGLKDVYTNSQAITPYTVYRGTGILPNKDIKVVGDVVYYRCTNVTSLIVNGEQLI